MKSLCKWLSAVAIILTVSSISFAQLPSYLPSNGLVAWYPFNGNANDESGNGNNGTVYDAVLTSDRFGISNNAYDFDGINSFINCGNNFFNGVNQCSISMWLKTSDFSGRTKNLCNKRRQPEGDGIGILLLNNFLCGMLNREPSTYSGNLYNTCTYYNSTSWNHVVLVNNNATLSIYLNGQLADTRALTVGPVVSGMPMYIGKGFDYNIDGGSNRAFDGQLDDCAFYERVLSPSEIQSLYYSVQEPIGSLLVCPEDGDVNCLADIPSITIHGAMEAGYDAIDVVESTSTISGSGCDYAIARTWTVTFSNGANTISESCTAIFRIADFEAPVFVNAPADANYQCIEEVPAYGNLEAVDGCGGEVEVAHFGTRSSSVIDTLACNQVTTPAGPGQDWALWINGLYSQGLASTDWYRWVGTPSLVFSNDGQARLVGDVVALNNPANGWHVDMTMAEGVDWAAWSADGGQYMDNLGLNGANHTSWNFYKLLTTISRLEGFGAFEGDQLILSHQPANYAYGFQFGAGANNRNTNNGGSGWFFYEGNISRVSVSGHGDVTLDMGCEYPNQPSQPNRSIQTCTQTFERRWAATDACGNVAYHTQQITIEDTTAPTFTSCPANVNVQCAADVLAPVSASNVNAADNCTGDVVVSYAGSDTVTTNGACNFVITHRYVAEDVCGNRESCSYTISVNDDTAPVLSVPEGYTISESGIATLNPASATDNCATNITITETIDTVYGACVTTYVRTFIATDDCGNTATASQNINRIVNSNAIDSQVPVFTSVPAGGTFSCDGGINFGTAEAIDACGLATVTYTDELLGGNCPQTYTVIRTWTATDYFGNTASATSVYNVTDDVAPIFTSLPADASIECSATELPAAGASASDNCDTDVTITYIDILVAQNDCQRTYERHYTAADDCGNTTTQIQMIYVNDTSAPVISGDATITLSCNEFDANGIYVSATDNCGEATITILFDEPTGVGCGNSVIRHYAANDGCTNSSYFNQTIAVIDFEAPVASADPADATYSCNENWFAAVVEFNDNCDSEVEVSTLVEEFGGQCNTVYKYTWIATDNCGNTTVVDQYITILDETAPIFDMESSNVTVECGTEVSQPTPTATDNCAAEVVITSEQQFIGGNCESNYTVVTTYTATDNCGNVSSISYTVNYQDTNAPVWSSENVASFSYECNTSAAVVEPLATDACGSVDYLYTDGPSESNGCTSSFVRSWVAVDACGNASAAFNQTITFEDTTDPVLVGCPGDLTLTCDAEVPAAAEVTTTDNCDQDVSLSMVETCINCPADGTNGLELFTPARPLDNPCNYQYDWAMALFSLPSNYRWYQLDTNTPAEMVYNADGTVTVTGRVFNAVFPTGGFDFNVTYGEAKDWIQWNTDGTPSGFKADCGGSDGNFADWMYYILQPGAAVELTGWGSHSGSLLNLTHAPSNEYFGFQIGDGANNYNADYGAGGWFNYSGVFLYEGQPVSSGQSGGIGDFAFRIDQCPEYSIVRTWTAIDCAGNTTSCSQTILFSSQDNNLGAVASNCIPGSPCDDRNSATINDQYDRNCNCAGQAPAPMAGQFLICPADGDVDCLGDVPSISFLGAAEAGFDAVNVVESTTIISGSDCDYTIARTWTVTFSNGETTFTESCTAIFRIADFEAPVFVNAPANASYQCIEEVPAYANLEAIDGCGGEVIVQQFEFAPPRGRNEACSQTIERRWAATDACGNVAYHTQIISVNDTTAPTFTSCPASIEVTCADDVPAPLSASDVNAADNCTSEVEVVYAGSDTVYYNGKCHFAITHYYTATDVCGNRESCSYTILVNDNIAPTLNVPASYTVECNADVFFEAASATDNCSSSLNIMESVDTLVTGCVITYTRTFSVSDDCGNTTTGTQTINVIDTTAPVLNIPADYTVECNDEVVFAPAAAFDNCVDNLSIIEEVDTVADGNDCTYTYTRTFTVADACGNTSIGQQVINVIDTEAPAFVNLAGPYAVECDAIYDEQWVRPAATDNCDSDLTYTYEDNMTSGGCLGVIHRIVTITDNCGNATSQEFVIYIQDTTAPVITWVPADATVECSNVPSAPGVDAIQTTDNCGDAAAIFGVYAEGHNAEVTVTFEQQIIEGSCAGSYTILWIWTATDYCDNSSTATTTITVVDTTAPVFISNPENITINCGDEIPGTEIVAAADNCTGDLIIAVSSDNTVGGSCAGQYLIERVYTATDACGNVATYTQNIFVEDTTAPIFNPDNESTFAYECDEDVAVVTPVAVDDCSGVATAYTDVVNGGNCATYITRTWTATDDCGNQTSFVQNISVLDTEAPVIDFVAEIDRPCDDWNGIYASAADNCDTDVEVVFVGDEFISGTCVGRIVRTYSATDDCGNTVSVQQIITLIDTSAPVAINQPENITVECGSVIPTFDPSWVDNCTNEITATVNEFSVASGCNTIITETYTAADVCGNSASVTRVVTIIDTTNPTIVGLPENVTIDCGDDLPAVAEVSAFDNCDNDVTITSEDVIVPGNCAGSYLVERIYRATDNCGNQSIATQNIYVVDSTAPIFNADNESTFVYECDNDLAVVTPVAVDDCSGVTVQYTDEVNTGNCVAYITRIWTATDGCGNSSTFVQNITLNDTTAPVISLNYEIEASCDNYSESYATIYDNCDSQIDVIWFDEYAAGNCVGNVIRTYSATDDCGNTSVAQQIITLIDTTAPIFEPQASIEQFNCASEVPLRTPVVSDNCSSFDLQHSDAIVSVEGELQLQRTWTATDACGNQSTWVEIFLLTLGEPGMACSDGNPCTINDTVDENCNCRGTQVETAVSVTTIHACEPYTWNGQTYAVSGNYEFATQTVSGCDSLARLALTVGTPTFSSQSVTNCGSYTWNGTSYSQSGTYTYVTTNNTGCPNTSTLNLTVNTPSTAASSVVASANNVSAGTSVTLTVQGGSLGSGASWKWYRSACGGTLIGIGTSITITANATETYFVRAEGTCNTTSCVPVTVTVLSAQCGPELVSASSTRICSGSSTTLTVLGTLYPGAIWRWRRNSCSGTIVGTGANLVVAPTATTTYYVRAEGGTCGITLCMEITIIVDKMPSTPSVISGPTTGLCNAQNVTYSVTPVSTVQQYNWTVPPGITIVSGQGTSSVTVNVSNFINTNPTNGNPAICVTAQNSCGISPIRCLSLTTYPATPASISGSTTPCINSVNTYSCPAVFGASSYTWQVPTGWVIQSGQGTASITVLCNGTSGNVRVRSVNACGNSTNRSLACAPAVCGNTAMPMQLELWPNPTSERVFFAYDEEQPELFEIYDMMGRTIYSGSWIPEFDVTGLAGGIYFVRATSGRESVVKRMEVIR